MLNQSIVVPNKMKQALRDGQPQVGTMISEIRQAAGLLLGEIRDGYRHLRNLL